MQPIAHSPADPARNASAGVSSPESVHATLHALVERALSAAHAALWARPVPRADGGIDWCTDLPGDVVAPAALTGTDRAALRRAAEARIADLAALQRRLAAEGPASRATARLLAQALETDLQACLHGVGNQPVLAPWGVGRPAPMPAAAPAAAAAAPASALAGPAPAAMAAVPAARRSPSVHAVASVLLLVVGAGALAAALHHRGSANPASAAQLYALAARNAQLGDAIGRARAGDCRPVQ